MLDLIRRIIRIIRDLIARLLGRRPQPEPPPPSCPISWQPSVLAAVFYGVRDYAGGGASGGPPALCRVFFPSIDGAVFDAPILEGCCRFPLIVFSHGNCAEPAGDHFIKWYLIPAQLARSGYVVVVPMLEATAGGSYPWDNDAELQLLKDVISWMRTGWSYRDVLMPEPATGAIGHSYGALLAARLVADGSASVYASLSGAWSEWPEVPANPIWDLTAPKLFTWGSGVGDAQSQFDRGWDRLRVPKHRAVFDGAGHWDYLSPGASACESNRGPCALVAALAADVVSTFFGKYLPPECWPSLGQRIPESLVPPTLNLTNEQRFFGGSHLMAFTLIGSRPGCAVSLSWATPVGAGSARRP